MTLPYTRDQDVILQTYLATSQVYTSYQLTFFEKNDLLVPTIENGEEICLWVCLNAFFNCFFLPNEN